MADPTPQDLINSRGGCKTVSNKLGWPYTTVHTWHRLNTMPDYRRQLIATLPVVEKDEQPAAKAKRRAA
jgi:hypothetical protein